MNAHLHFDATDAEFRHCFGLSLKDAGFESDRFFHTYGDLPPERLLLKPGMTTTWTVWTWGAITALGSTAPTDERPNGLAIALRLQYFGGAAEGNPGNLGALQELVGLPVKPP